MSAGSKGRFWIRVSVITRLLHPWENAKGNQMGQGGEKIVRRLVPSSLQMRI